MMDPTQRVISAIDGKEIDRVPTFSYYLDYWPVQQVLGKEKFGSAALMMNPVTRFVMDRWGKRMSGLLLYPIMDVMMEKSVRAAVTLGFDSVVGLFERMLMLWDGTKMARVTGSFYDIVNDGHGNAWYMYRGPGFRSPKDYYDWPHFPDLDDLAHETHGFFKRLRRKTRG